MEIDMDMSVQRKEIIIHIGIPLLGKTLLLLQMIFLAAVIIEVV